MSHRLKALLLAAGLSALTWSGILFGFYKVLTERVDDVDPGVTASVK